MRIVRLLALAGLVISGYLLFLKLNGTITSLVGCGVGSGCENVLGSKWSQWFGLPVSGLSTLLYLGIFVLTFRPSIPLFKAAAYLLVAAAIWFMGLQIFVIKTFCPWCLSTHLIGLATAFAIFRVVPREKFRPKSPALFVPLFLFAVLALGQIFGPEPRTYEVTNDTSFVGQREKSPPPTPLPKPSRMISFQGGAKTYAVDELPILGPPTAKYVLVKYFDYTCKSCLAMEGDLEKLREKYPDDIAVIVLPSPLNRTCNPHYPARFDNHEHACELARLGLAAWRAAPEKFPEAHALLFARPVTDAAQALKRLLTIIPAAKLEAALADPWVGEQLEADIADFGMLAKTNPMMPKLLVSDQSMMQGTARSPEEFIRAIERVLKLP